MVSDLSRPAHRAAYWRVFIDTMLTKNQMNSNQKSLTSHIAGYAQVTCKSVSQLTINTECLRNMCLPNPSYAVSCRSTCSCRFCK